MKTTIELNETWLNGNYSNGEINTSLPFVAVNDPEFFAQGDDAYIIISDIFEYWNNNDVTTEEAFDNWINYNL